MPVTIDYRIQTEQGCLRTAYLPGGRREVPGLEWADVLQVLIQVLDSPVRFYVRDFLVTMIFSVSSVELTAVFCSQGPRRGEVVLSVPATTVGAADLMQALGDRIEARRAAIRQAAIDSGIPADYYDAENEDEEG